MNFGQVCHFFFFFSSSFFFLSLQIDQELTLAGHPSLSPSYSLCPLVLGHKEGEEPEAIFANIALPPLSYPLRLGPQSATSCRPGGPPRPHLPATATPAPHLPSLPHRRRLCARPWRPRVRRQASCCCLAINAHWPPSMPPNRCQPPRPAIGPAAALALTVPPAHRGRRERASRSRSSTRPLPSRRTLFCTASSVHSRDTHAQHAYASTCPARDQNRVHLD
jgi:hypothetical protein